MLPIGRMQNTLAIIGGTGLYDIPGLCDIDEVAVDTPYGTPSDTIIRGRLDDSRLLFLPRHSRRHSIAPHRINYRANVCALKKLGATHVVSVSAVGSMREDIAPGHLVLVDQYIDLTRKRVGTFFDSDIVAHVSLADPVCPHLAEAAAAASERAGAVVHRGGCYVCIEGPQFSTRAESHLYRTWGASVIGMTAMPEARLAREAELPYATLALATDYDCWHVSEAAVDVEIVLKVLRDNAAMAKRTISELVRRLPAPSSSPAATALKGALITAPEHTAPEARRQLDWLLGPSQDNG